MREFAGALAFNWLIAGTGAHAKNYSLLLSGSQARHAPLGGLADRVADALADAARAAEVVALARPLPALLVDLVVHS